MTNVRAIDLGLPSGTLWADRNLGADAPEKAGGFFHCSDVSADIQGKEWQTPTEEQIEELHVMCVISWEAINGTKGVRLTGPNGNSIFLPLAGVQRKTGELAGTGKCSGIWSSSRLNKNTGRFLFIQHDLWDTDTCDCNFGFPIRPVLN